MYDLDGSFWLKSDIKESPNYMHKTK